MYNTQNMCACVIKLEPHAMLAVPAIRRVSLEHLCAHNLFVRGLGYSTGKSVAYFELIGSKRLGQRQKWTQQ